MDSIAKTSLLTAAMRAAESRRTEKEGRLFNDPYADLLAGHEGTELREKAIAESGDQPAIAIRTAYMDQKITAAVNDGVRQIVMLAAGMDTRAYRLAFPAETTVFELDRPEVLNYKKEKLAQAQPHCERKAIAVDLRENWQQKLVQAGFQQGERTLWLVEGLLMYLEESQVVTLINRINSLASSRDIMLCDILSQTLLESPYMKKQLDFLENIGAGWKFGTNDPIEFMKKLGWQTELSQAADVAPDRWPFPSAPLHIPNIPRGYYAKAHKI